MIESASETEALARTVDDNGGVFFVPAFAGLLAPYWRGDARGLMCGLTAYNTKAHVVRAVLESTAFQVRMRSPWIPRQQDLVLRVGQVEEVKLIRFFCFHLCHASVSRRRFD